MGKICSYALVMIGTVLALVGIQILAGKRP